MNRWNLAALCMLVAVGSVPAQDAALTRITIPNMHCAGCVKKIDITLLGVPGVAKVESNLPATISVVKPKPEAVISPRAIWEALEKINKKPSKLEGPSGTFTEKPAS